MTLVDFGKYGADNLSYTELYHSTLAGHACYVKWVRSRSRNLNGQFKDLGLYIARMENMMGQRHIGEFVEGTLIFRAFKQ